MARIHFCILCLTLSLSVWAQGQINLVDAAVVDTVYSCPGVEVFLNVNRQFPDTLLFVSATQPSQVDTNHVSEGFLVTLSDSSVIHFFRFDPGTLGNHVGNSGRIVKRISLDGGQTWGPNQEVFDEVMVDDRNVHGGLIGTDSVVLFFRKFNGATLEQIGLYYIFSADGGNSWTSPVSLNVTMNSGFGTMPILKVPGRGYLMAIYSDFYVELRMSPDGLDWSHVIKAWDYRQTLDYNVSEACFSYLGDGRLLGLFRDNNQYLYSTYYQVVSSDTGYTWTEPVKTNICDSFFSPAPLVFFDPTHQDVWVVATDRRNYCGDYPAQFSAIWIYRNKVEEIFTNPLNYHLHTYKPRPSPNFYRLYGYPAVTRLLSGNYLIVFSESYKKPNNLEEADFYQFYLGYESVSLQANVFSWNTGDTTQLISADSSGWYFVTSSASPLHQAVDSIFVSLIRASIESDLIEKEKGIPFQLILSQGIDDSELQYFWSTGDTVVSPVIFPEASGYLYLTVTNGLFSCADSVFVLVTNPNPPTDYEQILHAHDVASPAGIPTCFPNPASVSTRIHFPDEMEVGSVIRLVSSSGELVRVITYDQTGRILDLPLASVPPGTYFLLGESAGKGWGIPLIVSPR